ncbi:MAG: leucine-rich repeat protein [Bacteroidaceae bacterium]|nr:leucine-rich repeat protein [Bacteroidaceae bacterium]
MFTVVTTAQEFSLNGIYYIPNSVTTIEELAFSVCTALISLEMLNSVTTIGSGAFYNCTGLKSLYCMREVPASIRSNNFSDEQYATVALYVPTGSLEKYKAANI